MFVRILAIEESLASALVANEILTMEEVAYVPLDELLAIEGMNDGLISQIRPRAREYLLRRAMGDE